MAQTPPTPAEFKLRYPAFAAIDDEVVQYWLTDAEDIVTDNWFQYQVAIMSLAAHNMQRGGVISSGVEGAISKIAGVTSFKSGAFSATFSNEAVAASVAGGYASTRYGQEFYIILRRNRGGPRSTRPSTVDCCFHR